MLVETRNLILRDYTPEDLKELYPILSDSETMGFWQKPLNIDEARAWIRRSIQSYAEHGFGRYAVILRRTGKIIGDCGIMRTAVDGDIVYDLGYIIHRTYWGKGYATEAAAAVKRYAFNTLGIDTLHANMPYNHHASRRVAEKIGMTRVAEFENEKNRSIRTLLYVVHSP